VAQPGTSRWSTTARGLLPWVATALAVAWLAWTTDFDTFVAALADMSIPAAVAIAVAGMLVTFLTDAWCVKLVLSRFVAPVSFREALPIKATSYFLNVLNYNLALVGMAFYVQRSRNAPFWKALGSLFFLNLVDILALCVLLAFGLLLNRGTDTIEPALLSVSWLLVAGGLGGFLVAVLLLRAGIRVPLLSRLLRFELLAPLTEFDLRSLALLLLVRVLFLCEYLVAQYLFLRLFAIDVPVARLFVYLPLLTFVQVLPVNALSLGPIQHVTRHFYLRYVPATVTFPNGVLDAFSTISALAFNLCRIIVAWVFLGDLSREVIRDTRTPPPA
jgi:hypothetical protein